uniref:Uncharacterized protein n=1 Tax=viral metagenome TaxID=1070528 RepID=A0A6M3LKI0_9ZZZZ
MVANVIGRRIKIYPKHISQAAVKTQYKVYKDNLLRKYGLERFIQKYVVNLKYVDIHQESAVIHAFRYANRNQVGDVIKAIKRVKTDFTNFVCIHWDKAERVGYPHQKTLTEVLDALEFILDPPIQVRTSYGFLRVLEKYSAVLGVSRDDHQDDDNWQKLYGIEIRRVMRHEYDPDTGKIKPDVTILVRKRGSSEIFKRLKPDGLRGERVCMSGRKLFKVMGG